MPTRLADGLEAKNLLLKNRCAPIFGSPAPFHFGKGFGNLVLYNLYRKFLKKARKLFGKINGKLISKTISINNLCK